MKVSKFQFAILALIAVTGIYVAWCIAATALAFAGAWHYREKVRFGTVIFFTWYAVACYSAMKSQGMLKPELTRLRVAAAILAIIGGVISALCGGYHWMYYLVTGCGWRWMPEFGFVACVLGMLIILGGVLISRGRIILGGNLALWCGIAGVFSTGGFFAMRTLARFFPGVVAIVLGFTLTIIFPVLGGVLSLMSRGESK
jgi:hypothetical protein